MFVSYGPGKSRKRNRKRPGRCYKCQPMNYSFMLSYSPPLVVHSAQKAKHAKPVWQSLDYPYDLQDRPIAAVVSNNVQRRSGRLYENTTKTIANDPGDWDDLDRPDRTEFYRSENFNLFIILQVRRAKQKKCNLLLVTINHCSKLYEQQLWANQVWGQRN